jgi:hypothetical protein
MLGACGFKLVTVECREAHNRCRLCADRKVRLCMEYSYKKGFNKSNKAFNSCKELPCFKECPTPSLQI